MAQFSQPYSDTSGHASLMSLGQAYILQTYTYHGGCYDAGSGLHLHAIKMHLNSLAPGRS